MKRINIGCGQTPTLGWDNYDNSISVRIARTPILPTILDKLNILEESQKNFISFAKREKIKYANATKRIPELDNSVDVLYTSHMLEHLDRDDAVLFLKEATRVLVRGGIIRIAVPDIKYHIEKYLNEKDANSFIEGTHLTRKKPRGFLAKAKYIMIGDRNHQWMYDGTSLCFLLSSAGFIHPQIVEAGVTLIKDPGHLDLAERYPESVFVEAWKQ